MTVLAIGQRCAILLLVYAVSSVVEKSLDEGSCAVRRLVQNSQEEGQTVFVRYQQQKAVCIGRQEEAVESRFAKLIVDNDRQHGEWSDHFFTKHT